MTPQEWKELELQEIEELKRMEEQKGGKIFPL
jgi:hypothetical protein